MTLPSAELNPLAAELNQAIRQNAPVVMRVLSELGKKLYFPKGILTQSAEANQKAHRYNATIGEAREQHHSMGLPAITRHLCDLSPDQALPYAPSSGRVDLRKAWLEEIREKNPSLGDIPTSVPVVTSGITHGLSTIADMFADEGDVLFLPDQVWGNYKLVFNVKRGARIVTYRLYDDKGGFDLQGLRSQLKEHSMIGKIIVLLNFPNNPTGYSVTPVEADGIRDVLVEIADNDCDVVAICDDAYFGLFYGDEPLKESVFTRLAGAHPNILAVKLDGASKEDYAWGLRVGFITYAVAGGAGAYEALEKKTGGCIRGTISNSPNLSQTLVLKAMADPDYRAQKAEKYAILSRRAAKVKQVLAEPRFSEAWTMYPFNAGYFMCVRLKDLDAEEYRVRLLNDYGVGVISTSDTDIRIALSCVDEDDLPDLFDIMLECALEMKKG
ncbi:MAG: aminotransferase class I/II-fold pyridoxal phosphate-dependent enzyme [Thermoleophilia bacterium]|nr:aminotransferase class I/II-fold pyridoxal phosphate-dependent enzyme [Thermoleophilia bacterium]